jgi:hypothetical protein
LSEYGRQSRGRNIRKRRDQLREGAREAIDEIERTPVNLDPQEEAFLAEVEAARLARMGGLR